MHRVLFPAMSYTFTQDDTKHNHCLKEKRVQSTDVSESHLSDARNANAKLLAALARAGITS